MSLFSDFDLQMARAHRDLEISPWNPDRLGPASYDVTLSGELRVPTPGLTRIDLADVPEGHTQRLSLHERDSLVLHPGACVLGSTVEHVVLGDDIAARYEGRSSLGRLFLASHITAGFLDPGFEGTVTLEIVNHSPWELELRPGMRIGQLCFFRLASPSQRPYGQRGHYQHQAGPVESRFRP